MSVLILGERMSHNEIISKVPKDKNLYDALKETLEVILKDEGRDTVVKDKIPYIAYGIFIGAFYHNDNEAGVKMLEVLQKSCGDPHFLIYNSALLQANYYIQKAGGERAKLKLHSNKVGEYEDKRWRCLNPFLVPYYSPNYCSTYGEIKDESQGTKFIVGLRMTNFDKVGMNYFSAHGKDGNIKNYYEAQVSTFSRLKENPSHCSLYKFKNETKYPRFENDWFKVEGFEDYRVASFTGEDCVGVPIIKYVAFAVTIDAHKEACHMHTKKAGPRQSMFDLSFIKSKGTLKEKTKGTNYMVLNNLRPMRNKVGENVINEEECQKNWLPFFIHDRESPHYGKLLAIYSSDPFTVIEVDENDGSCSLIRKEFVEGMYSFRGSSPPVQWQVGSDKRYLYSVHVVGHKPNREGRVYYHRLVEISSQFQVLRISRIFYLNQPAIVEYISGSLNDTLSQRILFSYGFDDKEAWIASLTYDEVESLFLP